jgi:hypothetical protein
MRGFESFTRLPAGDRWFDVYEITSKLFAIHEPGHFEEPTSSLLLGEQRAALIDTGCGIGSSSSTRTRTSIIWAATSNSTTPIRGTESSGCTHSASSRS